MKLAQAQPAANTNSTNSKELLKDEQANELVVAIVGHIGSGTSEIAEALNQLLSQDNKFDSTIIKASKLIETAAAKRGRPLPGTLSTIERIRQLQNEGDALREAGDYASVAVHMARAINRTRRAKQSAKEGEACAPDGTLRAYVIDSIRHPAEVHLLRTIYRQSFILIGVVCDETTRTNRLLKKFQDKVSKADVMDLMARDAKFEKKHGQQVSAAFYLSDAFVDNSQERFLDENKTKPNEQWTILEEIQRLINAVTRRQIIRPRPHEAAMKAAHDAALRSACLSRQVGAAIANGRQILATGTNDVPRAFGGLYVTEDGQADHRCAFRVDSFCSNNKHQDEIIHETSQLATKRTLKWLEEEFEKLALVQGYSGGKMAPEKINATFETLRLVVERELESSRIKSLIEFSRAVHAEMDAILSAGRRGVSTEGATLYVTTFPCHSCARHIVAAGIVKVVFIEPYPKSQAIDLHGDSISYGKADTAKVVFEPYVGVAPRLFTSVFEKDRDLKDSKGQRRIAEPEWIEGWSSLRLHHSELEEKLPEQDA